MAVQQNKKSASKRGMHRAHDFLTNPPTAIEPSTGEVHRRHHISPNGFYRGKKVVADQERRVVPGQTTAPDPTRHRATLRSAIEPHVLPPPAGAERRTVRDALANLR